MSNSERSSLISQHALFLRAINTGDRRVTNEELVAPLFAAGFVDATAYQAAGNLIVSADGSERVTLDPESLTELLSDAYGFDTPVFVRNSIELRSVLERCPFTDDQIAATSGKVQVTFMGDRPSREQVAAVEDLAPPEDLVSFDEFEWYWLPVDGVSGSKLPVKAVERIVGPMTMRTLGTVRRIVDRLD